MKPLKPGDGVRLLRPYRPHGEGGPAYDLGTVVEVLGGGRAYGLHLFGYTRGGRRVTVDFGRSELTPVIPGKEPP